jgi:hypothetical protein
MPIEYLPARWGYQGGWKIRAALLVYEPNSYGKWQQLPEYAEPPLDLEGSAAH